MSGGAIKKPVVKKSVTKKKVAKTVLKPTVVRKGKKLAPKKIVKKVSKKINLKVRTVNSKTPKKSSPAKLTKPVRLPRKALKIEYPEAVLAESSKKTPLASFDKTQDKSSGQAKKQKTKVKTRFKNISPKPSTTPKGKIITKKTDRDKIFLMWTGVSFFMILIVIFWIYNIKENLQQARLEGERSEKAITWNKMTDELNEKMLQLKTEINVVRSFASSSQAQEVPTNEVSPIFQKTSSSSETIDDSLIQNLKHDLEIKTGVSAPGENDYFFMLEEEKLASLLSNLTKIKKGDDLEKVKKNIGEASKEQVLMDQRGIFVTKIFSYYIKIYQEDRANDIYDRYINLEFDKDDLLVKIDKVLDK